MKYLAILRKRNGHGYDATVPDLPGCIATGGSVEEAVLRMQEAASRHVFELLARDEPVPRPGDGIKPAFGVGIPATIDLDIDLDHETLRRHREMLENR